VRVASKLLAVAVAIALWVGFSWDQSGLETLDATVRYLGVPAGMEVNPDETGPVTVTLKGGAGELARLRREGLSIEVDCGDAYGPGLRTYSITSSSLEAVTSAEFVKATPSQIRFSLEERLEREVDVVPEFSSRPQAGYIVEGYSVHPPALRVVGPADRVGMIETAGTDPIDLSETIAAESFQTTAFLSDPYCRFDEDSSVTVYVRVRKR